MNSGYVNLITGTKAQMNDVADYLYNFFNDYDDMSDEDIAIAWDTIYDLISSYDSVPEINWREIGWQNNYYDHKTGITYHIVNATPYDLD